MAQAGLNNEKNWQSKSRWTVPLSIGKREGAGKLVAQHKHRQRRGGGGHPDLLHFVSFVEIHFYRTAFVL